MYEAKGVIESILMNIIRKEHLMKKGVDKDCANKVTELVKIKIEKKVINGKILVLANRLQQEHKIFKRPFIVDGLDYLSHVRQEYDELNKEFEQ